MANVSDTTISVSDGGTAAVSINVLDSPTSEISTTTITVNDNGFASVSIIVNDPVPTLSLSVAVTITPNEDGTASVRIIVPGAKKAPKKKRVRKPKKPKQPINVVEEYGESAEALVVPKDVMKAMDFGMQCLLSARPDNPVSYLGHAMLRYVDREDEINEALEIINAYAVNGKVTISKLFDLCAALDIKPWVVMKTLDTDASVEVNVKDLFLVWFKETDYEEEGQFEIPDPPTKGQGLESSNNKKVGYTRFALEKLWQKYDANGSNSLDIMEVTLLNKELGLRCATWELYQELDRDTDTVVNKDEFFKFFMYGEA